MANLSLANAALVDQFGFDAIPTNDNLNVQPITQATAVPVIGQLCRVTKATASATASLILPSLTTNGFLTLVVNDSVNSVIVYPFVGESINGTLNGGITIATKQSAIFVPVTSLTAQQYNATTPPTLNWYSATFSSTL